MPASCNQFELVSDGDLDQKVEVSFDFTVCMESYSFTEAIFASLPLHVHQLILILIGKYVIVTYQI